MKRSLVSVLAAAAAVVASPFATGSARAETYRIDNVHSTVLFRVKHLNVGAFYGRFNEIGGRLTHDAKNPEKLKIDAAIKTESIDTNDTKRDNHLKSPDFFNARKHPTITFKSTSAKSAGDGHIEVTGDLTLLEVTKPITVRLAAIGEGKDPWGGYRAGFETTFTIKRSDFGMNFMPGGLGDDVTVTVALECIRE